MNGWKLNEKCGREGREIEVWRKGLLRKPLYSLKGLTYRRKLYILLHMETLLENRNRKKVIEQRKCKMKRKEVMRQVGC